MLGLHFTPACVLLLVCSLHFTHSLHFTPGPQSAVRSPQSAVSLTDRSWNIELSSWIKTLELYRTLQPWIRPWTKQADVLFCFVPFTYPDRHYASNGNDIYHFLRKLFFLSRARYCGAREETTPPYTPLYEQ